MTEAPKNKRKHEPVGSPVAADVKTESFWIPVWVEDMHRYYCDHGYYRATDLNRVLGRPTESFRGRATEDLCEQLLLKK
ncbi:MAG TPA: hypothetical protein VEA80_04805 [Vitreimonas sp.]|uniref:hypothetical protein n=1 Tax=Vitreimonas sp. TaxID=3069702 RepID=UPI002D5DBFDC|nr:hypothetical protein [Vitreimonas sp.]HYD86771.1 hypothetical protein [Vitreimonas sp.]